MRSSLYEIQDVAIQIAQIFSVMLQVDVEIIDTNHIRIAGTGHFREKINKSNIGEGHAYSEVLRTGKRLLVSEPTNSKYCEGCLEQESCEVLLEVGAPIIMDGQIEGVIGLTCWKKERKAFFAEHLEESMYFLDQMCDLVAGKLKERRSMQKHLSAGKMLHTLMRLVDKGIIILDREDRLIEYNQVAEKELKLSGCNTNVLVNVILTGDAMTDKREYKIVIDDEVYTVIGYEEKFDEPDETYDRVLIFDSIREYRNQVYHMSHSVTAHDVQSIIGHSEFVQRLKREILRVAANSSPVLIEGEEGTGKKVVGTAIWKASQQADKPFVYFNCASVSEELLEERLFGATDHEVDMSGNIQNGSIGVLEMANDGVLYLDEIDELPLYYQAKLEQVLDEQMIQRKGSFQKIPIHIRLITATKKNLQKMVEKRKFRAPFYYMICVSRITMLPLSKRREDIPDMIRYYVDQYTERYRVHFKQIDQETIDYLCRCDWNGNVTELEKTIEYMVNAMDEDGIMDKRVIPPELTSEDEEDEEIIYTLEQVEQREILKAMKKYGDSKKGKERAAEALGIGIATLYRKLDRLS